MDEDGSGESAAVAGRGRAKGIIDIVAAPKAEGFVQGPERGNNLALDEDAKEDQKGNFVDQAGVLFLEGGRLGDELLGRGVGREWLDVQAGGGVGERADESDPIVEIGRCDQGTEPAGRENKVVVGQDDERGVGRLEADIAGAGEADVLGRLEDGDRRVIF